MLWLCVWKNTALHFLKLFVLHSIPVLFSFLKFGCMNPAYLKPLYMVTFMLACVSPFKIAMFECDLWITTDLLKKIIGNFVTFPTFFQYLSTIVAIKMNPKFPEVTLNSFIYIFFVSNLKKKHADILSCLDNCLNIIKIFNGVLVLKNIVQFHLFLCKFLQ